MCWTSPICIDTSESKPLSSMSYVWNSRPILPVSVKGTAPLPPLKFPRPDPYLHSVPCRQDGARDPMQPIERTDLGCGSGGKEDAEVVSAAATRPVVAAREQ